MTLFDLAENIKQRRNILDITQEHLAEMAEIGLRTLKKIESGKGNPTIATVNKLAAILGMELTLKIKEL